jgi:hypothetical protein
MRVSLFNISRPDPLCIAQGYHAPPVGTASSLSCHSCYLNPLARPSSPPRLRKGRGSGIRRRWCRRASAAPMKMPRLGGGAELGQGRRVGTLQRPVAWRRRCTRAKTPSASPVTAAYPAGSGTADTAEPLMLMERDGRVAFQVARPFRSFVPR